MTYLKSKVHGAISKQFSAQLLEKSCNRLTVARTTPGNFEDLLSAIFRATCFLESPHVALQFFHILHAKLCDYERRKFTGLQRSQSRALVRELAPDWLAKVRQPTCQSVTWLKSCVKVISFIFKIFSKNFSSTRHGKVERKLRGNCAENCVKSCPM